MRLLDLTGQRFGRLVVISQWGHDKFDRVTWLCRCDCGRATSPTSNKLMRGETRSCGCLREEYLHDRTYLEGSRNTRVYEIWAGAKDRCFRSGSPAYKNYGGRGITMCDAWRDDFAQFQKDMGPRPPGATLDRIDNNGNYCPENCRWTSRLAQMRNQRKTRRYDFAGESRTLQDWSDITGLALSALYYRINEGHWSVERALTTPSVTGGNKPKRISVETPRSSNVPPADHA